MEEKQISPQNKEILEKKVEFLAKLEEKTVKAKLTSPLMKEIEDVDDINNEQKEMLKNRIEEMASEDNPEGMEVKYEELISTINDLKPSQELDKEKEAAETVTSDWVLEIVPANILCYAGEVTSLKVLGIYEGTIIHDLTSEVLWESKNENVAIVYENGMLISSAAGKTGIKATWLENISVEVDCIVMPKIPDEEIEWLNKSLPRGLRY